MDEIGKLVFFQVVLVAQIVCWTGQFIGHGAFEVSKSVGFELSSCVRLCVVVVVLNAVEICLNMQKRAPALLDNLAQAFIMAPFFVLLEV